MLGLGVLLEGLGTLLKSVSAIGRLSRKVICGQGPSVRQHGRVPSLFCVTDFAERCNGKEAGFGRNEFCEVESEDCETG